jgi:hypothetical protein
MRSVRAASATILSLSLILTLTATGLAQTAPTGPSAAVPRVMNLAGVFQPVDGQPLRAVETVTVALYTDATGGTPLWQETQSVAVDSKGRYAFLLGAASAEGIPVAVLAAGARWLGTTFDRPGEVESPRVPLTSVPYALRAADAETLGGHPASAYLLSPSATSGKGGTATTGKGSAATTSADAGTPSAVVQPGTTNFLAKYVNAADVGNSALYEINGTVGLGTTTPFDLFHIRFTNTAGSLTGFAVQNLGNTATSYSGMLFYDQNGALGQFQGFNNVTHEYRINNIASSGSINFMIGSSSKFLIANNGRVGLGVAVPGSTLDVAGDTDITVNNTASTANALQVTSNTNGTGRTAFFNATGTGTSVNGINAVQVNYADNTNLFVFPSGSSLHTGNGLYVKSGNGADFTFGAGSTWGSGSAAVKGDAEAKVGVSGSSTSNAGVMGFTKSGTALYALASSPNSNGLYVYYGGATASTTSVNNLAIFATGSGNMARIDATGKGFFNGGTQTGGADVAEAFTVAGDRGTYGPGDVLVIATSSDRTLEKSRTPYSTAVIGVYATKPGVLLTPRNVEANHDDMVPLGALGVMPTKVTAENGPIHRGDLLVTSRTPGHAMRAGAHPAVGTVIGKALGNFAGPGAGVIEVFVNVK